MNLLSLGSSEAPEVLALSTASAVILITFALLIFQSLEIQPSEVVSSAYTVISPKLQRRVLLVSDSLLPYSSAQNSGCKYTFVRAFQILPPFPISWLEFIDSSLNSIGQVFQI